jgi:voltage-gated potassium channel
MKIDPRKILRGHLLAAVLLIVLDIAVGTVGYMLLESLSPLDALYHTVISVTTVGYSDVAKREETRVFTMFIVLLGVASFYYFAGAIAQTLITGRIFEVFKLTRIEENLGKIKDHVILCGYGDVGSQVAEKIKGVVVVERNEAKFNDLVKKGFLCVNGDSTNPESLKSAGIGKAKAMIVALDSDPEVVYTILTAKELNPEIKVYARANETTSVNKMKKAGAAYVICLPEVGSRDLVNALEGRDECIGK